MLGEVEEVLDFIALLGATACARAVAALPAPMRAFAGNCELAQLLASERGAACLSALMAGFVRAQAARGVPAATALAQLRAACPRRCPPAAAASYAALDAQLAAGAALVRHHSAADGRALLRRAADALRAGPPLAPRALVAALARLATAAPRASVPWRAALLRAQAGLSPSSSSTSSSSCCARWTGPGAVARHARIARRLLLDLVAELVAPLPRDTCYDVPSAANGHWGTLSGRPGTAAWEAQVAAFLREMIASNEGGGDGSGDDDDESKGSSDKDSSSSTSTSSTDWVRTLVEWLAAHDYSRFFLGVDSRAVTRALAHPPLRDDLLPRHLLLLGRTAAAAEAYVAAATRSDTDRPLAARTADAAAALAALRSADASASASAAPTDVARIARIRTEAVDAQRTLAVQAEALGRCAQDAGAEAGGARPLGQLATRLLAPAALRTELAARHHYDLLLRLDAHAAPELRAATWRAMLAHLLAQQPPLARVAAEVRAHATALRTETGGSGLGALSSCPDALLPVADVALALETWAAGSRLPVDAAASARVLADLGLARPALLREMFAPFLRAAHLPAPVRTRLAVSLVAVLEKWLDDFDSGSSSDGSSIDDPRADPTAALVASPGALELPRAVHARLARCQQRLAAPSNSFLLP